MLDQNLGYERDWLAQHLQQTTVEFTRTLGWRSVLHLKQGQREDSARVLSTVAVPNDISTDLASRSHKNQATWSMALCKSTVSVAPGGYRLIGSLYTFKERSGSSHRAYGLANIAFVLRIFSGNCEQRAVIAEPRGDFKTEAETESQKGVRYFSLQGPHLSAFELFQLSLAQRSDELRAVHVLTLK